jgi:16S rRNA G1207 methylase RsmC
LSDRLPTQTVRSEDQIEWQQFSTPSTSLRLTPLANVQPDDIVLEPSAGNGLLVAQLRHVGSLHLNELDPPAVALKAAFLSIDHRARWCDINSTLASVDRPTLILMNPPFSRSVGRGADDYAAVRHLQAALRRLQPGGRLVAIMPDWFGPSARMREQYETILRDVSVLAASVSRSAT